VTSRPDLDRHCGPAAVAALFAHRPQDVLRLFHTPDRRREAGPHCAVLARMRRPYREVSPADLARVAGTQHHGGLVAVAMPRPVPALDC
jgi:TrmH RNA methyltransferase